MHCIKCGSVIDFKNQNYFVNDMGSELMCVIEEQLGHQDGVLCQYCFKVVIDYMSDEEQRNHKDRENNYVRLHPNDSNVSVIQHCHNSNVCFNQCCNVSVIQNCGGNVHENRYYYDGASFCVLCLSNKLDEKKVMVKIASLNQEKVPETAYIRLCSSCLKFTQDSLKEHGAERIRCVYCRRIIDKTRGRTLTNRPQRDLISEKIYPRKIPDNGLVCIGCWFRTKIRVRRLAT